jgi:hypothetical protein
VEGAYLVLDLLPGVEQPGGGRRETRRPPEHAKGLLLARHEMRTAQAGELQPVLEQPQESVVAPELGGFDATDVAALSEGVERVERRPAPHGGVGVAVHELQQLDGELDIAEPPGPELELDVDLVGWDVRGDPLAHPLHRLDEAVTRRRRPHHRGDAVDIALPQLAVAGERTRLEQRLELPRLRPALVVGEMRVEGAHKRAVLALRPQVGIHLPQRRLDSQLGDAAHGLAREQRRDLDGTVAPVGHEDDVDVAQVVELAGARLAHADDRERCRCDLVGREARHASGELERGVECRPRVIRESRRDAVDDERAVGLLEVPRGESHEFGAVRGAQCVPRRLARESLDGLREARSDLLRAGGGVELRRHGVEAFRMPLEERRQP